MLQSKIYKFFYCLILYRYKYYHVQIQKLKGGELEFTFSKYDKKKKSGNFFSCGNISDKSIKKIAAFVLSNKDIKEISDMSLKEKSKDFVLKNYLNLNPNKFMKILKEMNNTN
jgi:hypothetical protein